MLTVDELNNLPLGEFLATLGNIIEHSSVVILAAWYRRPFLSFDHFVRSVYDIVDNLPSDVQRAILGIHPDLAGRLTDSGGLTSESKKEQSQAGMTSLATSEKDRMRSLNDRYCRRFGFPFVICARLASDKSLILSKLEQRLANPEEEELRIGIAEVKKICLLRTMDLVQQGEGGSELAESLKSKM